MLCRATVAHAALRESRKAAEAMRLFEEQRKARVAARYGLSAIRTLLSTSDRNGDEGWRGRVLKVTGSFLECCGEKGSSSDALGGCPAT